MTAAPKSESHPLDCYRLSDSHLVYICPRVPAQPDAQAQRACIICRPR